MLRHIAATITSSTRSVMTVDIITTPFQKDIYGFGAVVVNKDFAGTAFKLSGRMWELVKAHGISNKGLNIWVYENGERVFAGVELTDPPAADNYGLEEKKINLKKYAYYKHIGPYHRIKEAVQGMRGELAKQGLEAVLPYIEIYGHWTGDANKSETELLMGLK